MSVESVRGSIEILKKLRIAGSRGLEVGSSEVYWEDMFGLAVRQPRVYVWGFSK